MKFSRVAVHGDSLGKGIGSALIDRVEQLARDGAFDRHLAIYP